MSTMRGNPDDELAYAIAEKQLYSSHYLETALDLSLCVRGSGDSKEPGFYLIMAMGSEQAGLTGPKGSLVRKVAVGRSVSNLRDALTNNQEFPGKQTITDVQDWVQLHIGNRPETCGSDTRHHDLIVMGACCRMHSLFKQYTPRPYKWSYSCQPNILQAQGRW